jgi:hypothetical protein
MEYANKILIAMDKAKDEEVISFHKAKLQFQLSEKIAEILMTNPGNYYTMQYQKKERTRLDGQIEIFGNVEVIEAEIKKIVIPEIVYSGLGHKLEWRCRYCNSPNDFSNKHCSRCGAPRGQLIQELNEENK